MPKYLFALAMLTGLVSSSAFAQLDPPPLSQPGTPFLTPESPTPTDVISVNAYTGPCDGLYGWIPTEVTRTGNAITVVLTGVHNEDSEFCVLTPGTASEQIGSFPAGSYSVTVIWQFAWGAPGYTQILLGVLPLTVTAPSPPPSSGTVSVPTLDIFGMAFLMAVLTAIAFVHFRQAENLLDDRTEAAAQGR